MSVIVYGPQGCGKTLNKTALAARFGMREVIDEWAPGDPLPDHTLALTNVRGAEGAIAFSELFRSGAVLGLIFPERFVDLGLKLSDVTHHDKKDCQ